MYGNSRFTSSDVVSVYSDVAKGTSLEIGAIDSKKDALHAALDVVLGSRGVDAKRFGHWARRVDGAHIGGFQLELEPDPKTNANRISVKRT
jgi:hypothetical protein